MVYGGTHKVLKNGTLKNIRAVGLSENPGRRLKCGGHTNLPSLFGICRVNSSAKI